MTTHTIGGTIVDIVQGRMFRGSVRVEEGRIAAVTEEPAVGDGCIVPGLVDAHVHVESSMLPPSSFAALAVVHGTVAAVADPHEIANVLGIEGVRFMVDNAKQVPFKFLFGAPSCVPATDFETAGARLDAAAVAELLAMDGVGYLSEVMNFPGVLTGDPEVTAKVRLARERGLPVDGHAPGLMGDEARRYAAAGISTDHECCTLEEARARIAAGMHVQIREGSAARNFDALLPLLAEHPDRVMFCSDDKHPDDLVTDHMDRLVRRAIAAGHDPLTVLRCCVLNPVRHYNLSVGMLQPGDPADYLVVDNLESFRVLETRINGVRVAEQGTSLIEPARVEPLNRFSAGPITEEDILVPRGPGKLRVMQALDGRLDTGSTTVEPTVRNGMVVSDPDRDLLKIVVLNRYGKARPAVGFVRGFGLRRGAVGSTVAHDSHNIIAVGDGDAEIVRAVNLVAEHRGGISCVSDEGEGVLPLPLAGLMSLEDGHAVAARYREIDAMAKRAGASLAAPFMTLSFMALLVIPELKLSDRGLFDGTVFSFTPLFTG
ncbi:MAG: adenine deaminase [Desulfobulbaceae bacterium]